MSREAWEAVQQNSKATGGELAYLQLAAYRTFDKISPFTVRLSPQELAAALHVSDSMIRRYQRNLIKLKELEEKRSEHDGRQRVYAITLEVPELSFRNQEDTGTIVPEDTGTIVPEDGEVSELSFRKSPWVTGTIVPVSGQSIGTGSTKYRNDSSAVPYLRETYIETDIETEREREAEARSIPVSSDTLTEAEETTYLLPPSPMSVMGAKEVWRLALDDLTDQKSKHELDSWYARVSQVAWRDDGALILRGAQSLMRFQQFRNCVEYALRRLGADIEVEYQERDERRERKARMAE